MLSMIWGSRVQTLVRSDLMSKFYFNQNNTCLKEAAKMLSPVTHVVSYANQLVSHWNEIMYAVVDDTS